MLNSPLFIVSLLLVPFSSFFLVNTDFSGGVPPKNLSDVHSIAPFSVNNGAMGEQNNSNRLFSPYTSGTAMLYARAVDTLFGCSGTDTLTLSVGALCAENCTNGLDDDSDGLVDCEDTDCPCCDAYAPTISKD